MFKRLSLLWLIAAVLVAQPVTLTLTGPATIKAGQTLPLTLSAAYPVGASANASAFQWSLNYPSGVTAVSSATSVPTKVKVCTADQATCILAGSGSGTQPMNMTAVNAGAIASYVLQLPSTPGPLTISLSGLVAVDGTGLNVAAVSGTPFVVAVLDPRDLNGDTKVDAADVSIMITEVLASKTNPAACVDDQTGDGKCDLLDVAKLILKALGLVP